MLDDFLSNHAVQRAVTWATVGGGVSLVIDWLPRILGTVAVMLGISVSMLMRKKIKKEIELLEKKSQ